MKRSLTLLILITFAIPVFSESMSNTEPVTISTRELKDFQSNPRNIQQLLQFALELAGKNIHYQYGSADPNLGGMDCSGTVYYILNHFKVPGVPRSSHLMYQWAWQMGDFHPVNAHTLDSFEFAKLHPGDLLFWSGTYQTENRDPNVSHVMIYLGKNQANQMVMIGASNGRTYQGKKIYGVSVFDFSLPNADSKSKFLGYSCIPKLTCGTSP